MLGFVERNAAAVEILMLFGGAHRCASPQLDALRPEPTVADFSHRTNEESAEYVFRFRRHDRCDVTHE